MVKVQKPQPKSLTKSSSIEGVTKKKGKQEKAKKLPEEAVVAVAANAKKLKNASPKPVEAKAKEQKKPAVKPDAEKKQQTKAAKRPMILAPAQSPSPAPAAVKKSKVKAAAPAKTEAVKRALILAPPESPVVPKKQGKSKAAAPVADKKEKSAKKVVETEAPPAKKSAPAKKSVAVAPPAAKKPAAVATPAKKSAAPPAAKKSDAAAAPAKKSAAVAPPATKKPAAPAKKPSAPAKKPAAVAPGAKKSQKPATAEEPKKSQQPAKPAASLQKKAKSVQKISKPAKAPKGKRSISKKNTAAKGKPVRKELVKTKKPVELTFELKSFDEDRYKEIVSEANVTKISEALKTLVEGEVAKKKATSIFTDYRYMLQVASYKIASCPKRVAKLSLKHSLVSSDDDVAIIVPDLQRGAKFDFEPTKQHYEDLFREAGVEQRLTIVPFNQLRNEMGTFEAKRKFLNSYDYLLCDGRLSGQATAFLGKFTQKPRNVLHAVRLTVEADQLAEEVTRALKRTAYRQLAKGDLTAIPVGNHQHSAEQLAENILQVSKQLQKHFPGGLANIRSLYLKIDIVGTSALPLYVSMCAPPADTPYVVGPREQRMLKLKKQANEVLSRFAMTKDAEFVKLTADQVKRKAELKKEKAALVAADAAPKDNDGEDTAVPTKKARKESNSEAAKAEEGVSDEEDAEEAAGEDESGEDGDDTDDDDIDEEDDDEDEEDDDDDEDEEDDDDDDDDDEDDE
ncbi:hypothetical protein KR200_011773 [Drosophila serrata]|nr:hypothetical protein KR200_011773 [Drosophila serrata]